MKKKVGIIYSLKNSSWSNIKKCGRTQELKKRLQNLQTSLLENCEIVYVTNTLLDTHFYEYLLKNILKQRRIKSNKEFFDVDEFEIKMIFDFFNELNLIFNDEIKLNNYIQHNYPEYLKKRKDFKNDLSSSDKKFKKRKGIYVDTSH